MSAIPVWRKAKMDHECSSWPTEAPTRFHSTHWTQSKDTKLDTKSQKCWEKRRSFSSFTAQPAPSTQRPHSRSSSITWQTFTSLAVTWPCDILCVCVCMAGRWPGQQRRERWQCKPRSPSPPRWNTASKVSFQTSYPRSTETSHWSSGVHIFCEFSWALLKCSFTQFLLHEFHTSIPSVLFKTSGSLPVSSLLRRHAVPWMQFRQLQEHSRSSSQKTRHRHTSLLETKKRLQSRYRHA